MPVRKLRLVSLVVEIGRVVVQAVRGAGPFLLVPVGLLVLQLWASLEPVSSGETGFAASLVLGAIGVLSGWLMLLVVSRSSLQGRSGMDLFRLDRLALMLLAVQAASVIVTGLIPLPQGSGWQALAGFMAMVVELLWTRATLLLSIAWATGAGMTWAGSWRGLRGNFLRLLGLGFLLVVIFTVFILTYAYNLHGNLDASFLTTIPPLAEAILAALGGVLSSAILCAVYRQLVMEPAAPDGTPEPGAVSA